MTWVRHQIDSDIIREDVQIFIYENNATIKFDESFIQFPPIITKDSKSVNYDTKPVLAYEPMKIYKGGESRSLGIEFQWITGGQFSPDRIKRAINMWKQQLYQNVRKEILNRYPLVRINKLYHVIEGGATFRIHNVSVKYSEELIRLGDDSWPIHTTMSVDLELAHQIMENGKPTMNDERLKESPIYQWY